MGSPDQLGAGLPMPLDGGAPTDITLGAPESDLTPVPTSVDVLADDALWAPVETRKDASATTAAGVHVPKSEVVVKAMEEYRRSRIQLPTRIFSHRGKRDAEKLEDGRQPSRTAVRIKAQSSARRFATGVPEEFVL